MFSFTGCPMIFLGKMMKIPYPDASWMGYGLVGLMERWDLDGKMEFGGSKFDDRMFRIYCGNIDYHSHP